MAKERFDSIWDAVAPTAVEAESLRVRSELMRQLIDIIRGRGWEKVEAANRCGITMPHFDELTAGRVAKFSVEALINIATALKVKVHVQLHPTPLHGR